MSFLEHSKFAGENMSAQKKKKTMHKTTIQLSEDQYFFLKEKSLVLQKQRKNYSIVSIIRDLIDDDRKKWIKERN
jgi:hypothetical protein